MRRNVITILALMSFALTACQPIVGPDIIDGSQTIPLLTMVMVPAGSFQRDSTASNISTITKAYRMSKHEITRAQFLAVFGSDPSYSPYATGMDDPVQKVNWYHALAFCNLLSITEKLEPVYTINGSKDPYAWDGISDGIIDIPVLANNSTWDSANCDWNASGYRLPTNMEWMWAAMGSTQDARNGDLVGRVNTGGYTKAYPGSTEPGSATSQIGDFIWYSTNSGATSHPVGTKNANELGLYDMGGNVWEMCWDWFEASYPSGTLVDHRGPASHTSRIAHGGCYNNPAANAVISIKEPVQPCIANSIIGFRVVRY